MRAVQPSRLVPALALMRAMTVSCPFCGAPRAKPCMTTPGSGIQYVHAVRGTQADTNDRLQLRLALRGHGAGPVGGEAA
jgi:hypothetical protein